MKKIFICLIALGASFAASAQVQFGVKGGFNLGFLAESDATNRVSYDARPAYFLGALAEFTLQDKMSLAVEALFAANGARISQTVLGIETKSVAKFPEIMVPVLFKIELAEGFKLGAGPYVGLITKAEAESKAGNVSASVEMDDYYKDFDMGMGFDAEYSFNDHLFINARYNLGLMNISDYSHGGAEKSKLSSLQIGLGYKF